MVVQHASCSVLQKDHRFSLAVFRVDIRILLISRQSLIRDCPSVSVKYADMTNSLSQYSVSAVSFREICSFAINSALLTP